MANRFSSGKHSIAICDRCSWTYKLSELRTEFVKTKERNILVCASCWDPDHPQLQLGMYPIDDPQAVRNPRPDSSYPESREIWIESTVTQIFAVVQLGTGGTVSIT